MKVKTFMLEIISRENLNYKAYSAIATIPRQLFDYCVELDLLESNPMDKVKIKKNVSDTKKSLMQKRKYLATWKRNFRNI